MKKLILIISILAVTIASCSIDDPFAPDDIMESISFENKTSSTLQVEITSTVIETDINSFSISPNSIKSIKTEYGIIPSYSVSVTGDSTLKIKRSEYSSLKEVVFYSTYLYEVEYKITGTASSVDVTLNNSSGGTSQYDNVTLPHSYTYSYFSDWFLYVSAQNQGSSGSVTVTIHYQGSYYKSSTSSGAYVIATASGSKD